jgi:hypothetical protein
MINTPPPHQLTDDQLSIVLQGPCQFGKKDEAVTTRAIASIRQYFPKAELILSTWKNSTLPKGLDVDIVVFNKDPGGQRLSLALQPKSGKPFMNNVNRQLVSSLGGTQAASRTHVLKARTDMVFYNNSCLNWWDLAPHRNPAHSAFKQRVLGYAFGSRKARNPSGVLNLQYHPGDWFYLGLKEDLIDFFDIPLCPDSCVNYLLTERIIPPAWQAWVTHQWFPEMYLWVTYLKKKGIPVTIAHSFDNRPSNDLPSIQSLVNNFILLDAEQLGFVNDKYRRGIMEGHEVGLASMMCYQDWLEHYLSLCVPPAELTHPSVKRLIARSLPQQQWQPIAFNNPNTATGPALNNNQDASITLQGVVAPSGTRVAFSSIK